MNNIAALMLQSSAPSKGGAPKPIAKAGESYGFAPGAPVVFESLSGLPTPPSGRGGTLTSQTAVAVQSGNQVLTPGATPVSFPAKAETTHAGPSDPSPKAPHPGAQPAVQIAAAPAQGVPVVPAPKRAVPGIATNSPSPQVAQRAPTSGPVSPPDAPNTHPTGASRQAVVTPNVQASVAPEEAGQHIKVPSAVSPSVASSDTIQQSGEPSQTPGPTVKSDPTSPALPTQAATSQGAELGASRTEDPAERAATNTGTLAESAQKVGQASPTSIQGAAIVQPLTQPPVRDAGSRQNPSQTAQTPMGATQQPVASAETPALLQSEKVSAVLLKPDVHPVQSTANRGATPVTPAQQNTAKQTPAAKAPPVATTPQTAPQLGQGTPSQASPVYVATAEPVPSVANTDTPTAPIPVAVEKSAAVADGSPIAANGEVPEKTGETSAPNAGQASVQLFSTTEASTTPQPANATAPVVGSDPRVSPLAGQTPVTSPAAKTVAAGLSPALPNQAQSPSAQAPEVAVTSTRAPLASTGTAQANGIAPQPQQSQTSAATVPQTAHGTLQTPAAQTQPTAIAEGPGAAQAGANQSAPNTPQPTANIAAPQATPEHSGVTQQSGAAAKPQIGATTTAQTAAKTDPLARPHPNSAPEAPRIPTGQAPIDAAQIQRSGQPAGVAGNQSTTSLIAAQSPAAPAGPLPQAPGTPVRTAASPRDGQPDRAAPLASTGTAQIVQGVEQKAPVQPPLPGAAATTTANAGSEATAHQKTGVPQTGPQPVPTFAAQQAQVAESPAQAQVLAPESDAPTLPNPAPLRSEAGLAPAPVQKSTPVEDKPSTGPRKFAEALTAQIKAADVNQERTRVALNPRGLGHIDIEIRGDAETGLKVTVRAENPTVLQSLRDERGMLAQAIGMSDGSELEFQERQRDDSTGWTGDQHSGGPDDIDGDLDDAGSIATTARSDVIDGRQLDITT